MGYPTLFERIGGRLVLDAAVKLFYQRVLADSRINFFFAGVEMARQRSMLNSYLSYAFGSPICFTGRDLRSSHARLVVMGLNNVHFDALTEIMADTLKELSVPQDVIEETLFVIAKKRSDVLGSRASEAGLISG